MLASLSLVPSMWLYVSYFMLLTGIVTIIGIVAFLFFSKHYKKIAFILGITGLIQIVLSGFAYYPYYIFIVIPLQSVSVGIIALSIGTVVAIYGSIKEKNRKMLQN